MELQPGPLALAGDVRPPLSVGGGTVTTTFYRTTGCLVAFWL